LFLGISNGKGSIKLYIGRNIKIRAPVNLKTIK